MATANNSECYLIRGVELDSDHDNVLIPLGSTATRANYFLDNTRYPNKTHYTNLSYIRPEVGRIRVNGAITAADYNANYVMFRNQSHENKWFYGFVNRVEYVSDNAFDILFELDYINTYMEQLSIQASHIVRAHQATDNFGDNLEAEPFSPIIKNTGGYTIGGEKDEMAYFIYAKKPPIADNLFTNLKYAFDNAIHGDTQDEGFVVVQGDHNNYMLDMANNSNVAYTISCRTGTYYFYKATRTGADSFLQKIYDYIKNGYVDSLLAVGICPNVATAWNEKTDQATRFVACQVIANTYLQLTGTVDGYTPHNKKCLTSQYNYVEMEGENVDPLYFEYSTNADHGIEITYAGAMQGGTPIAFATALNYDQRGNSSANHWDGDSEGPQTTNSPALRNQHRVTFTQYPTFGIVGSAFNQYWNFQTLCNTIRGAVGGIGGMGGGGGSAPAAQPATVSQPATTSSGSLNLSKSNLNLAKSAPAARGGGGAAGGGAALALQIGAQLVAGYQPTTAPTGGASNPSIESLTYGVGIKILLKQCIRNQIEKIDSFFDRYGYAINKCAIPNINARHYFTYIQLQNPDVGGDMPDEARQAFRDMLARGTTFFNTNGRIGVYRPATQNTPNN